MAKVNYIKLNANGDGVPVRVGQSYQFWIGGYWLQADGSLGKAQFCVGHRWELSLLLQLNGIYTIVSVNAKVYHEQLHIGRQGGNDLNEIKV